jgi:acyl phosphate:glycerol-3-phosphate acyltransferase
MDWIGGLLLGYLAGSVPFGLLLTRVTGAGDLRAVGSGNIGATNVLRTGRKGLAAATLLLDLGKGFAAVLAAWTIWGFDGHPWETVPAAALGAVLGHCFPVWLKFRGGKGVATLMGVSLGLAWQIGLIYALVWLGMLAVTRVSSLAGMTAAVATPFAAWSTGNTAFVPVLAVLAVLVLVMHRPNIGRLLRGEEPKVGSKQ